MQWGLYVNTTAKFRFIFDVFYDLIAKSTKKKSQFLAFSRLNSQLQGYGSSSQNSEKSLANYEEHYFEIILNLDQLFKRRGHLKIFF